MLFGWFGFLLLLDNLYTDTGISNFWSSLAWLIVSGIISIPFLAIIAYFNLWMGLSEMTTKIHHLRNQDTFVVEREIETIEKRVESLEGKIKEYLGYLTKLEQIDEKGEVTDEVYQDLKTMYIKELERYKIELNELKNKMIQLVEERGTHVRAVDENLERIHPTSSREVSEEVQGSSLFLFLILLFLIIISIIFAILFDPLISLIVLIVLVIAVIAGYHAGSG